MPHNLFLHSEVIQSREWNLKDEKVIEKQLKYEFFDTFFSMLIGWAIQSGPGPGPGPAPRSARPAGVASEDQCV